MTTTPHRSSALDTAVNDAFDDVDLTLTERYGSAKHPERPVERARAAQLDDATVDALGKLSEALEVVENTRGHLYEFHRMTGTADLKLQEAVRDLRSAGHADLADDIEDRGDACFACRSGACLQLCDEATRIRSNVGCEYWAVDLDNAVTSKGNAALQQYAVDVPPDPAPFGG